MMARMADEKEPGVCAQPALHLALRPHRSLGPLGFWILMGVICAVSFAAGIYFLSVGAWPVLGFFGVDVLAIYWAFRASYRSGQLLETLELTDEALTVRRLSPGGRLQQWTFPSYWLQVDLDEPVAHGSQIQLRSHGKSMIVGAFLSPDERKDVADTLRRALARQRALQPS